MDIHAPSTRTREDPGAEAGGVFISSTSFLSGASIFFNASPIGSTPDRLISERIAFAIFSVDRRTQCSISSG